jgi:probable HAF family extracellular repeat protein
MVGLGDLPGADAMSRATAVSSAGDVVVGQSSSTAGAQAFRWTAAGGMTGLGDLAGGGFSSVAHDVSADGSVIVGAGMTDDANPVAFVWTVDQGMRSLPELLADDYGIPTQLEGWNLIAAHSITPDAHAIVGTGINPDGRLQAWHVSLGQEMFMDGGHSTEDVQLRLGDRLQGHGELSGTVDIGAGATLSATNDFRLGSAATADAVRIGGRLLVNGQQVQLRSATPILVAGSIVMDSTDPSGEDCCELHFDTLTLQGTIHGGQLVGRQLELQAGAVLGESAERPVLIESPVTGEGFLDYVEIHDGFAPGTTEPVELRLGNVRYRSAELALDLHGPADQYDRLRHDGTAEIIGSLQVRAEPREGYVPPIQGGQFDDFELVSAANLLLADDASIELVYDGQMLGSLTRAESALKLHAGNGLFRIVELEPFSLRLINYRAIAGDADGDGRFGTDDLVQVLQHGKYEDVLPLNADWTEGDWNLDGDFSSSDLVAALQTGAYEGVSQLPAVAAVPEPASATLALLAVAGALLAPSPLAALAGRG